MNTDEKAKVVINVNHGQSHPNLPLQLTRKPVADKFQLLVTCRDETDQRMLFERLTHQGRRCRVLVM